MGAKKLKKAKSTLSNKEKAIGKNHIYILLAMIVVGLAIAIYNIQ